jgi:excisionase family DNA binding protein
METTGKLAYSITELAERLGLAERTVRKMVKDGRLPSVRAGDRWLIPVSGISKWLESAGAGVKCG